MAFCSRVYNFKVDGIFLLVSLFALVFAYYTFLKLS